VGLIFRKRVKLDDTTSVNLSGTGASVSKRIGRLTLSSRGARVVPDRARHQLALRRQTTPLVPTRTQRPAYRDGGGALVYVQPHGRP
jgi:hypothetical protein